MNTVQLSIIQALIKIFSPTSPAYGNTFAFERPESLQELRGKLLPGDVIFSRTDSSIYEMSRKYMGVNYDHVAVVINSKQAIHISPPIISKIDMELIIHPNREPLIIRPKMEDSQKYMTVIHNFLGEKYNLSAIPKIVLKQLLSKLQKSSHCSFSFANLKYSRICSDAILYALCRGDSKIKEVTSTTISKRKYEHLGFFMPDEVADILLECGSEIILKSKFQQKYKIVDYLCNGGQKVVEVSKRMVDISSFSLKGIFQSISNTNQEKGQKSISKVQYLQLFPLLFALGHALGIAINRKIEYMMLILNMLMVFGHFKQITKQAQKRMARL